MAGSNSFEIERKEKIFKKSKLIAEGEGELFKFGQKEMSLQDQTRSHTIHI